MGILVFLSKNLNQSKVLDLAVTEEGVPSLGRDGSTYQEYIVPAFLTQVDELDDVAVDVADVLFKPLMLLMLLMLLEM